MGGRPEGGADRCGAMHYATTSGIGSRIFCPAEKAMWEALRRTIECSSKPFCTDIEPAFLGVISLSALVIGRSSISASIDGRKGVRRRSAARYSRPARNHPGDSSESQSQDAADL